MDVVGKCSVGINLIALKNFHVSLSAGLIAIADFVWPCSGVYYSIGFEHTSISHFLSVNSPYSTIGSFCMYTSTVCIISCPASERNPRSILLARYFYRPPQLHPLQHSIGPDYWKSRGPISRRWRSSDRVTNMPRVGLGNLGYDVVDQMSGTAPFGS